MKGELLQRVLIGMLIVGILAVGAIVYKQNVRLTGIEREISLLVSQEVTRTNVVDPYQSTFGDRIGDMRMVSMGPLPGIQGPFGYDNIFAKFRGSVTVSGEYGYFRSDLSGTDEVCFTVTDAEDLTKIPRLAAYPAGTISFCFSNIGLAKEEFGPEYGSGQATIVIDDYEIRSAPAEVGDQARLVSVVPAGQ